MAENKPSDFQVVDKRRYTNDGELRGGSGESVAVSSSAPSESKSSDAPSSKSSSAQEKSSQTASAQSSSSSSSREPSSVSGEEAGPVVDFSSFIVSLATQTMMMLGEVPGPQGAASEINLPAARQTIDILALLEEKTQGNLSDGEKKLLGDVLASLRLAFVNKSQS